MNNDEETLKEKIAKRVDKLRFVPKEMDGKLVRWGNTPSMDAVEKIVYEEIYLLGVNLRSQIDSLNIVHPEKDECPSCERFREYGRALEYVLKRLGENKK